MLKKLFLIVSLTFLSQIALAETCPTVADIKNKKLADWKLYDSEDGKPLSAKRSVKFKDSAVQFLLAEWSRKEGKRFAVHCYYSDKNGSDMEAYLTKNNFMPKNSKNLWYQVSEFMQCAAGSEKCEFTRITQQPQLANK